jgi:hypothetical protein
VSCYATHGSRNSLLAKEFEKLAKSWMRLAKAAERGDLVIQLRREKRDATMPRPSITATLDFSNIVSNLCRRQILGAEASSGRRLIGGWDEYPAHQVSSTGIELAPDAFDALPDVLSYLTCLEGRLQHAWWTREAWLEEAVEVSPTEDEAASCSALLRCMSVCWSPRVGRPSRRSVPPRLFPLRIDHFLEVRV